MLLSDNTDSRNAADWYKIFEPQKRLVRGKAYVLAKRFMDLVFVFFALPGWLPLFSLIAFLVWLSDPRAPVIFYQLRTGKSGKRFRMYKFRTMVPNAEELKMTLAHLNELKWPDFKITNDKRHPY